MKFLALLPLAFSLGMSPAFADHHENHDKDHKKCECSKECKENCSKGKSKDCKCEACDCKESKTCH